MLATIIGTAAALVAVLEGVTGWGRQLVRTIRRVSERRRPDHRPLYSGAWPIHLPPDSNSPDVRITVFCAPSDTLRDPKLDLPSAVDFIRNQMGLVGEPAYSGVNDGVRVESAYHGGMSDYAWVCASGRLDLSVSIPVSDNGLGRRELDVIRLLAPIATVAEAVRSSRYDAIFGLTKTRRNRRFDWLIGVSMYSRIDGSSVPSWEDVIFPSRPPARLVSNRPPFCPPTGFATEKLQNWDPASPTEELLATFLRSFLIENGYHDFDDAIADAVATVA